MVFLPLQCSCYKKSRENKKILKKAEVQSATKQAACESNFPRYFSKSRSQYHVEQIGTTIDSQIYGGKI